MKLQKKNHLGLYYVQLLTVENYSYPLSPGWSLLGKPLLFIHHINLTLLSFLKVGGKTELIKCIYPELQQIGGEGAQREEGSIRAELSWCREIWAG